MSVEGTRLGVSLLVAVGGCAVCVYLDLLAVGLVFVFQLAGIDLFLDLAQCHGEGFGSVDVIVLIWEVEGLRNGLGEVIVDHPAPIGEYLVW